MKEYSTLSKKQKVDLIDKLYVKENKSFADIAKIYGTYPNKILRDAKSFNVPIRTKSEAQKNALKTGKHKHPTKGKERSEDIKNKIGKSVMSAWENLTESELNDRKAKAQENWSKLTEDKKLSIQKSATDAVRLASKLGSKLEHYLLRKLIDSGYAVDFHKEHTLVNTKLQIDLFVRDNNIAIEVDGPSHFAPVWGEEVLKRNITYDQKKEGLIIGKGWHLIRVQQQKDFSKTRADFLFEKLRNAIVQIIDSNSNTVLSLTIED